MDKTLMHLNGMTHAMTFVHTGENVTFMQADFMSQDGLESLMEICPDGIDLVISDMAANAFVSVFIMSSLNSLG